MIRKEHSLVFSTPFFGGVIKLKFCVLRKPSPFSFRPHNFQTFENFLSSRHNSLFNLEIIMSNTSIIEFTGIDLDIDPFHSDELSILSFTDDIIEQQQEQHVKPNNTPLEINISHSVPVSDDESISEASLFSGISFHTTDCSDEQQSQESSTRCEAESSSLSIPPASCSMEELVAKLNKSMMRSARTRALISKNVYPDLNRNKLSLHKAQQRSTKHKYNSGIATQSLVLGTSTDNSICGFLRATKKW